ncbi:MAG: hypothetical protein AAF517_20860, partial [Planctomycetota bacterium]
MMRFLSVLILCVVLVAADHAMASLVVVETTADGRGGPLLTLRDAIDIANAEGDEDTTIILPGTSEHGETVYVLDACGDAEDQNASGDLDILKPSIESKLYVVGAGSAVVIEQRCDDEPVVSLLGCEASDLEIRNLRIRGGSNGDHGQAGGIALLGRRSIVDLVDVYIGPNDGHGIEAHPDWDCVRNDYVLRALRCTFASNHNGVRIESTAADFESCTFENNSLGGIHAIGSLLEAIDTRLVANEGCGVECIATLADFTSCQFLGNNTDRGAVYGDDLSRVQFLESETPTVFRGNRVDSDISQDYGSALTILGRSPQISRVIFDGNVSEAPVLSILRLPLSGLNTLIRRCAFVRNECTAVLRVLGGETGGGTVSLWNTTLSNNSGVGISADNARVATTFCTIMSNAGNLDLDDTYWRVRGTVLADSTIGQPNVAFNGPPRYLDDDRQNFCDDGNCGLSSLTPGGDPLVWPLGVHGEARFPKWGSPLLGHRFSFCHERIVPPGVTPRCRDQVGGFRPTGTPAMTIGAVMYRPMVFLLNEGSPNWRAAAHNVGAATLGANEFDEVPMNLAAGFMQSSPIVSDPNGGDENQGGYEYELEEFVHAPIPGLISDPNFFPAFGLVDEEAGWSLPSYGLDFVSPEHPLALGLEGPVELVDDAVPMNAAYPLGSAKVIATNSGDSSAAIFSYEKGDQLSFGPAPEKRIGFFWSEAVGDAANDVARALLEQAIRNLIEGRLDDDHDGVPNSEDMCPNSIAGGYVVVLGEATEIPRIQLEDGCSVSDRLHEIEQWEDGLGYVLEALQLVSELMANQQIDEEQAQALIDVLEG